MKEFLFNKWTCKNNKKNTPKKKKRKSDPFLPLIYLFSSSNHYGLMDIYFMLWLIVHCCDYSFFSGLTQIWLLGVPSRWVLGPSHTPSSSVGRFFLSWHHRLFQVILYFPSSSPGLSHSSMGTWLLFLQNSN